MSLINDIISGKYDSKLSEISDSVNDRQSMLSRSITIGDRVRIRKDIRPKYVAGLIGIVESYAGNNLVVKLDLPSAARYYADTLGRIRIPAQHLEKI